MFIICPVIFFLSGLLPIMTVIAILVFVYQFEGVSIISPLASLTFNLSL